MKKSGVYKNDGFRKRGKVPEISEIIENYQVGLRVTLSGRSCRWKLWVNGRRKSAATCGEDAANVAFCTF